MNTYDSARFTWQVQLLDGPGNKPGSVLDVTTIENGNSKFSLTQVRAAGKLLGYCANILAGVEIQGRLYQSRETYGYTVADPDTLITAGNSWRNTCTLVVQRALGVECNEIFGTEKAG